MHWRTEIWSITLHDVIAYKVLVRSAQNVLWLHAFLSKSKYHRQQQCCHATTRRARNVKNLDYKNASSWTVTNSRTFLSLQITRIFMRERGRALAFEHAALRERLRPYGGIFVRTNRAWNVCAIVRSAQWDFRKFFDRSHNRIHSRWQNSCFR